MPLYKAPVLFQRGARSVGETAADGTTAPADTTEFVVVSWDAGHVLVATLTSDHLGRPGWVPVNPRSIYRASPPVVVPRDTVLPEGVFAWRTQEYLVVTGNLPPGLDPAWPEPEPEPELDAAAEATAEPELVATAPETSASPVDPPQDSLQDPPQAPGAPVQAAWRSQPRKNGKFAARSAGS
jgi:hypothetical protein